ncbi:COG1470 family protein [Candidatus Nitrosocosmicus sp. T]
MCLLLYSISISIASVYSDFPRKEIMDELTDVKIISLETGAIVQNKSLNTFSMSALDIQRVAFFEKINQLNSTMWIGDNLLRNNDIKNISSVAYGILIDGDRDSSTGKEGVDYQLELQWINNTNSKNLQNWNKLLLEYSSLGQYKIIDVQQNYSGYTSFEESNNYVDFSLDMEKISVSPSYRMMIYNLVSYDDGTIGIDLTNWINIPSDSFTISTSPEEITLRKGETKTIGLQILSSSGKISTITDLQDFENYTSLKIELINQNDNLTNSTIGGSTTEPIQIEISAPQDAKLGTHSIPVTANISFGSNFPSNFIEFQNKYPIFIDTKGYEIKSGNFTINVIEPLTFQEELKNFWLAYGSMITLIGAGFAGGLSSLFFEYIKERRNKNPRQ